MSELPGPQTHVYTPSELNQEAKLHIEAGFGRIWVQGEISNLSKPASGHQYFTLKDGKAQIRCALFKMHASRMQFDPSNGDEVLVRGQLSLYAPRGDYQLIADGLLAAGLGALHAEFERLKKALENEGLFDQANKSPLPKWPSQIAVVTSATGAALRDIRQTLARRWPVAKVVLYPSLVQGESASANLIQALHAADQEATNDVIILARGGGSIEDLWAFNNEALARAIFGLSTPLISGVGHETDVTIVDFVADIRAPTPTAAAVLATPDAREVSDLFADKHARLIQGMARQINQHAQTLDLTEQRLLRAHPMRLLDRATDEVKTFKTRLERAVLHLLDRSDHRLQALARTLNGLSPLQVLDRGYALVSDANGDAIGLENPVAIGNIINVITDDYEIESKVTAVFAKDKSSP